VNTRKLSAFVHDRIDEHPDAEEREALRELWNMATTRSTSPYPVGPPGTPAVPGAPQAPAPELSDRRPPVRTGRSEEPEDATGARPTVARPPRLQAGMGDDVSDPMTDHLAKTPPSTVRAEPRYQQLDGRKFLIIIRRRPTPGRHRCRCGTWTASSGPKPLPAEAARALGTNRGLPETRRRGVALPVRGDHRRRPRRVDTARNGASRRR